MYKDSLFHELEMYRSFIQFSDILFSRHALDGSFTYVSPTSVSLLGYEQDELFNTPLFELIHPADKHQVEDSFSSNIHQKIYYRFRKKEGDYIWLETAIIPFLDGEKPKQISCISRDVTFQIATKEQLEENKEIYRLLVENFQDTVGIITKRGHFIYINEAGKKLFGVTGKEELIGKSVFDFLPMESHAVFQKQLLKTGLNETFEMKISRHDEQLKHVQVKLIPTKYKERSTYQILIRDMTEQKKAEELMHRTEKLSVVGQLAAGIAHEIRNPLTVIKGFTQLLSQEEDNDYLNVVLDELERIEDIVSDLLILAKPQPSRLENLDISQLLSSTIDLFKSEAILHNVEIIPNFELSNPWIKGEPNKLKQVYINIIKNAIEAMPKAGGKIYITAQNLSYRKILTRVQDTGVGIPKERIPNLGEPFYSTKEKGTGLGLMICNRIIKNHGGTIKIDSELNKGTTISIIMPAADITENDELGQGPPLPKPDTDNDHK
ncbi:PAS domain S-box protein [Siminovitchia sp. FSL H7-0308]|uniref:PAS domain S-box protein n=1 Tax=Siminovitchia sp. FSL H7-0308 TaxID=2921432 RepID=UPI0030ED7F43